MKTRQLRTFTSLCIALLIALGGATASGRDKCEKSYLALAAPWVVGLTALYATTSTIYHDYFETQGQPYTAEDKASDDKMLAKTRRGEVTVSIPVSLKKARGKLPTIVIYPERHDCDSCLEIVEDNRKACASGTCLFAEEGQKAGVDSLGIEEPESQILAMTLLHLGAKDGWIFKHELGANYVQHIVDKSEFTRPIWNKAKAVLRSKLKTGPNDSRAELEKTLSQIDSLFEMKSKDERDAFVKENEEKIGAIGVLLPQLMLTDFINVQSDETKRRYPQIKQLEGIRDLQELADPKKKAALQSIILDLRNESFARSVLALYESKALTSQKELRVRIGAAHLVGLYHLLRTNLDATEKGKEVQIGVDVRHLDFWKLRRMSSYEARKKNTASILEYEKSRIKAP